MSQLDWRKEKAILEQKNEFLQLQVIELKEREENQKKFNESILSAYNSMNDGNKNSKVYKEIQLTLEQYSRELIESKNRSSAAVMQLENENRDLRTTITNLELRVQQLQKKVNEQEEEKKKQPILSDSDRYSFVEERNSMPKTEDNKENIQQQVSFSSSDIQQNSTHSGCIVSIKQKQHAENFIQLKRSKTQLATKKPELSISNVLNCKNSNVMEINTHNLDFFKGLDTQSSPNSSAILRQLQKRQDSHSPNRLTLAQQLKQLTSELKHAKNIQKENETDVSSSQLKHEIKFMINKLLKAKGKMTESFVDRRSLYERDRSEDRCDKRSLAEFSRQINAVRSIENFQQAMRMNSYKF
ncbi:hypothetical protein pb186bvf_020705 [Paramecium bursaria]